MGVNWLTFGGGEAQPARGGDRAARPRSTAVLRGLAFGSVMLASSAINNLFVTYHLDFFLSLAHLSPFWFYFGHSVFMVWNSVNDLIFGWLSDTLLSKGLRRSRLPAIRYGGGLWALAFFLVWFPWGGPEASPLLTGLNWMANLCLYDSMLTLVEVNHSALLAELTTDSRERAYLNSCSSVCAALGSLSSLAGHMFWFKRGGDMGPFRAFAAAVALGSFGCFQFAAFYLRSINAGKAHDGGKYRFHVETERQALAIDEAARPGKGRSAQRSGRSGMGASVDGGAVGGGWRDGDPRAGSPPSSEKRRFLDFIWALGRQTNFVVFAGVAAVQTFDCALGKNFFVFFLDCLVGDALSPQAHGAVLTASFLLPWLAAAALSSVLERTNATLASLLGAVWLARLALLATCALLLLAASLSAAGPALLWRSGGARRWAAAAVLLNRVMSESVCRLVPLVESDLIDEHRYLTHRATAADQEPAGKGHAPGDGSASSMAASLVGTAHFVSKPSVSLGPMAGYLLLSRAVPQMKLFAQGPAGETTEDAAAPPTTPDGMNGMAFAAGMESGGAVTAAQRQAVAWVVVAVPLACVIAQLALWQRFNLRGKYLASVKRFLLAMQDESSV